MSINGARVLLGGSAAGAVRVVGHRVLDTVMFAGVHPYGNEHYRWVSASAAALGSTTLVFIGLQLIIGCATVWLYDAIRPRFGGAARSAITAGVLTWAIAAVAWSLTVVIGAVPLTTYVARVFASLPIALVAALVGASLYRDRHAARARAAGVSPTAAVFQ